MQCPLEYAGSVMYQHSSIKRVCCNLKYVHPNVLFGDPRMWPFSLISKHKVYLPIPVINQSFGKVCCTHFTLRRHIHFQFTEHFAFSREVDNNVDIPVCLQPLAEQPHSWPGGGLHGLQGGCLPPRGVQHHRKQRGRHQCCRMSSENCIQAQLLLFSIYASKVCSTF